MNDVAVTASSEVLLEQRVMRRVTHRIVWFLMLLFVVNFLDRTNVGFAALRMNGDIGITERMYGLGVGTFFLGYVIFAIPSNVLLHKLGGRIWISAIVIVWGAIATTMGFLRTPAEFLILRVLLGIAEAGFFPGVIFLLSLWIPSRYRARAIASFYISVPISQVIGAPLSVTLMKVGTDLGFAGWRAMYMCEGLPAVILGVISLCYLTDGPEKARWLSSEERHWLVKVLASDQHTEPTAKTQQRGHGRRIPEVLTNRLVWALALSYFGITSGSNAMNFFLPSVLQSFRAVFGINIGLVTNGLITALPYASAAIAMFYWTSRSDRLQERRKHAGFAALVAAASIAMAFLVNNPVVIVIGFMALAAGVYSAINVFWAIPPHILTGVEAAAGIALINSIGNLSGFVGPYVTGWLYSATHTYQSSFLVMAVLVGAGGVGVLSLPRRYLLTASEVPK
jgi:ACS family tartrate transporter-like MFS transporter